MANRNVWLTGATAAVASATFAFMPSRAFGAGDCCRGPWGNSVSDARPDSQSCNYAVIYGSPSHNVFVNARVRIVYGTPDSSGMFPTSAGASITSTNAYSPAVRVHGACNGDPPPNFVRTTPFGYAPNGGIAASMDCKFAGVAWAQCQIQFADDDPASGCFSTCL